MSLYSPGDEDGLQSSHRVPDFCWDMCQPICDIVQPGHAQQSLDVHSNSGEAASGDIPDCTISLLCRTPEEASDPGILSSNNELVTDLGMCLEEDRSLQTRPEPVGTNRKKCQQAPVLECTVCGKVFKSASSLSKHILVHSQKRSHICKVCKKAFKRNDHLMGHMLTHLKTKPFKCTEQGCNKSYCDSRSLRRHYVVQHGLCTLKEVNAKTGTKYEEPPKKELPKPDIHFIQNETVETGSCQSRMPSKDAFSCLVTGVVEQITSNLSIFQVPNQLVSQSVASNSSNIIKECSSLLLNSTSSSAYTLINTSSKDSMCPGTVIFSDSSLQQLNLCSDNFMKNQPVLQSHKMNCSQNQLDNSTTGSLGTLDYYTVNGKPIEMYAGSLNALSQIYVAPSVKAPGVTSLCPNNGNELSHHVMRAKEITYPNDPDFSKHVIQPCESSTCQIENPQTLQPMPNSQLASSHIAAQAIPNLSVHQCAAETLIMPIPPKKDMGCTNNVQGDPLLIDNTTSSYSEAEEVGAFSGVSCVTESVTGTEQDLGELLTSDTAADCNLLTSGNSKPWTWNLGNPHHKWSVNKGKLNLILSRTVPPSQVALDSFSISHTLPSDQNKSTLSIFNKIQGENICTLPGGGGGSSVTTGRLHTASGMMESTDPTALLLSVSMGEQDTIPCDGDSKHSRPLQDVHKSDIGSGGQEAGLLAQSSIPSTWITKDATAGHLVIPVSVPVSMKDQQGKDKVNGTASQLQSNTTKTGKKKKKRPSPKSLYIPPPLLETNPSPTGCFQSNLHSPTIYLSEYLQNGTFQCPPYTPPPMLSPIRQGSGLYFNTFCTTCTKSPVPNLLEKDTSSCGISFVKDDILLTIHPHINIGDRFQAEIPERKDALFLEGEEEKADLVWRPWLETKAVSCLLNLACSSAVPGGGNNLEFALHCLHLTGGNVMETLDKLLFKEPQEYLPRWLADYHYAGSDHWSLAERRQYKKAYSKNRKDFSYIQLLLPEKNVYQCVEYYYTWKKIISFDRHRSSAKGQGSSNEQSCDGDKCGGSMKGLFCGVKNTIQRHEPEPKEVPHCSQQDSIDRAGHLQEFACTECDRVFDRVKSRNAHMKRHRQQERALYLAHKRQWIPKQVPIPCDRTPIKDCHML
ncbi:zinc finger protein 541 isoform X2 [Pseudophryne corroboree]|uniref:zinc finger protein 541 isoform X2 n=1 Tax=Pseudophryne corroboree TaxID=495146 RepID=UPI003081607F